MLNTALIRVILLLNKPVFCLYRKSIKNLGLQHDPSHSTSLGTIGTLNVFLGIKVYVAFSAVFKNGGNFLDFPLPGVGVWGGGGIKVYMLLFLLFLKMEAIIFLTSRGWGGTKLKIVMWLLLKKKALKIAKLLPLKATFRGGNFASFSFASPLKLAFTFWENMASGGKSTQNKD